MKRKRCAELQMFHSIPQTYKTNDDDEMTILAYDHPVSLYTVPQSATLMVWKFSNRLITFESERPIRLESWSFAGSYSRILYTA